MPLKLRDEKHKVDNVNGMFPRTSRDRKAAGRPGGTQMCILRYMRGHKLTTGSPLVGGISGSGEPERRAALRPMPWNSGPRSDVERTGNGEGSR